MSIVRAVAIARMRKAFRDGQSASSFMADMKVEKLSYRRTDMLADWRSVNDLERKAGAMRYVRRDLFPTEKTTAMVEWGLSKEYMYKVKVQSRLRPDLPVTERFVNIMSDTPLTPEMVEQAVVEHWTKWEDYTAEAVEKIQVWTAVRRVME